MFDKFLLDKHLNDVYDVEGYTTSEVLCLFHEKITELIEEMNRLEINLEEFKKVVIRQVESNERRIEELEKAYHTNQEV